ncbi:MAG: DVU0298 family protein [Bilophila wadsworthia]
MQPRFRTLKTTIRTRLQEPGWDDFAKELDEVPARELVGPLFSCLPLGGEATDRAASALGKAVSRMADEHIEEARNVVRRLMWHMNEESGNIGWGIPEAFAEILAQHRRLGDEFYPILNSYVIDTGKGDNFCDNNVLRRSCFRAVERFALARPDLASKARGPLQAGLRDEIRLPRNRQRSAGQDRHVLGSEWGGEGGNGFLQKVLLQTSPLPKTFDLIESLLQGVRTEKGFLC